MKSASGKRPPDEAHGPGKEAIRPQQRCLGKSRKEGAHGHAALPAGVGSTLIQKIKPLHAFTRFCTAQHSKFQPNLVKLLLVFSVNCFIFKISHGIADAGPFCLSKKFFFARDPPAVSSLPARGAWLNLRPRHYCTWSRLALFFRLDFLFFTEIFCSAEKKIQRNFRLFSSRFCFFCKFRRFLRWYW